MIIELWTLIGTTLLLFTLIFIKQVHIDKVMGAKYALSNRAEPLKETELGGRISRALDNLKENLVLYTPLVLTIAVSGVNNETTKLAALTFFIARLIHAICYIFGVIYIRSAAWFVSIVAMAFMVAALL